MHNFLIRRNLNKAIAYSSDQLIISLDCFELETCVDIDRSSPLRDSCQDPTDLICRKVAQWRRYRIDKYDTLELAILSFDNLEPHYILHEQSFDMLNK